MTMHMFRGVAVSLCTLTLSAVAFAADRPAASAPAVPDYPKINMVAGYELDPNWPVRPLDYKWGAMSGVVVDAKDQVWIFHRGKTPIQVFSPEGKLVDSWGDGMFKTPHGLRLDPEGNVWTTDCDLQVVQKFTPKGKLLLTLGTLKEAGEDATHFNRPTDIAITPRGDVYVADGYANNRVAHYDAKGRFINAWGKLGVRPGEFSIPHTIAVDSRGRVYVCDRNNVRVQVFDADGKFLAEWKNLLTPWGIWITPKDEIFISGSSPMRWAESPMLGLPPKDQLVMKFDTTGRVQEVWTFPLGQTGKERPGELNWLHGIALDSHGSLYLGDIMGHRVQKFRRLAGE
jgi:DNA-binding beta-propeller fold protein YncE